MDISVDICWALDCSAPGKVRYVATPGICLSGNQLKVGAKQYILCDDHWAIVRANWDAQ
jgi:hypothetical protein